MTTAELIGILTKAQEALAKGDLPYTEWVDIDQTLRETIAALGQRGYTSDDSAYVRGVRVGRKEGSDSMKAAALREAEAGCCWWCKSDVRERIESLRFIDGRVERFK